MGYKPKDYTFPGTHADVHVEYIALGLIRGQFMHKELTRQLHRHFLRTSRSPAVSA
jgi:hypothetical protein